MTLNFENIMALALPPDADGGAPSLYALVDHGAIPELTKRLDRFDAHWKSLFEGSRDEGALEVSPILVLLAQDGRERISKTALAWLCDQGRYTSSLQFLSSPLDMPELSRRLALRLDAMLPESVEIVLRYFDCRIFESLMQVLSDEQRQDFLSVSTAWSIVNRHGNIQTYEAQFLEEDDLLPLEFSVAQEKRLLELSEPDQVAMLLRTVVPAEYEELAPPDRFGFLTRHIDSARGYGIDTVQAQALFCSLALTNGEQFAREPEWQQALADVAAKRMTFFDAVEQVG